MTGDNFGRDDLAIFANITPEFASPIGKRTPAQMARSTVVSSLADVILVSGPMAGAEPDVQTVADVREAVDPGVPVLLNTGREGRDDRAVPQVRRRLHRRLGPQARRLHLERSRPRTRQALHRRRAQCLRRGPLLLGIDLGSSGVKATLVSPERGIVASTSREVALYSDHVGWAEADPDEWWQRHVRGHRATTQLRRVRPTPTWWLSPSRAWCRRW